MKRNDQARRDFREKRHDPQYQGRGGKMRLAIDLGISQSSLRNLEKEEMRKSTPQTRKSNPQVLDPEAPKVFGVPRTGVPDVLWAESEYRERKEYLISRPDSPDAKRIMSEMQIIRMMFDPLGLDSRFR
ncbi:hypothetical protein I6F15_00200 [Bradyrhizobium sp. BRP14]|nr:hypothetical protein [Bradyrhizobium sp. BRP14]